MPAYGHVVRVPAEGGDVLVYPFEDFENVKARDIVADVIGVIAVLVRVGVIAFKLAEVYAAEASAAVVGRHDYDVRVHGDKLRPVGRAGASAGVRAAEYPHEYGFRVSSVNGVYIDGQVEAINISASCSGGRFAMSERVDHVVAVRHFLRSLEARGHGELYSPPDIDAGLFLAYVGALPEVDLKTRDDITFRKCTRCNSNTCE